MQRLPKWGKGIRSALNRDIAGNTLWIVGSSVVNMALGLVVTALTARYFGPSDFGRFNYALAIVVLFTAFSTLGLETLTVRSLVAGEHQQNVVLGTSLILRLGGGLVLTGLSFTTVMVLEPDDRGIWVLVLLLSSMLVFRAGDIVDYWFQSRLKSKIAGLLRTCSNLIASALKVLLVVSGGTIYELAAIYSLDALLVAIAFTVAFHRLNRRAPRWRWDFVYAKHILSRSWYVMLSGLMGTVYMRVDQVMLGAMLADKATLGIFAVSVTLSTLWYFIPLALIASVNPGIMRAAKQDEQLYASRVQDLYTMVAWVALAFCCVLVVFADGIVRVVYGPAYAEAAGILRVSVLAGVFALLGSARSAWLICEGLQRYSLVSSSAGAAINVGLNYVLIPQWGAYGAALATVAAQIGSVIIVPSLFRETRVATSMMLRALSVRSVFRLIRRMQSPQPPSPEVAT